jgi:hypothetical protein
MPIPDKTIFGGDILEEGKGISYGEIRKIVDSTTKLLYLKKRLEKFLLEQINPIGDKAIYSPFPLTILTCIAAETLGRVIEPVFEYEKNEKTKREIPKIVSVKVYGLLDKKLTRQLPKKFKEDMKMVWPDDDVKGISNYAELLHSYLRTPFIHGYRGKNVFLTEEPADWAFEDGSLFLNPYWFWRAYKLTFYDSFNKILDTKHENNPYRKNALAFLEKLLN